MKLSRDQAINEFRRMWAWIALETYGCKQKIEKEDYIYTFGYDHRHIRSLCFLCEYDLQQRNPRQRVCDNCPIEFIDDCGEVTECDIEGTVYMNWVNAEEWQDAAKYAWEIANLEEKTVRRYAEEE